MAQLIQFLKSGPALLTPATPEASEFLQRIKLGEWVGAEFRRTRNYQFHKRFFKLLQLGFEYWTPAGGTLSPGERQLVEGFVKYLVSMAGQHGDTLSAAADDYLHAIGQRRAKSVALLKSFEPYRAWAIVEAGYYDTVILPDGLRRRVPKSISFARMNEDTFHALYKSVLNVLWNFILFRCFRTPEEAENVAAQLLEFA